MKAAPQHEEVKSHYKQLASEYSSKANQTCEVIYEQLVRRYMNDHSEVLELGGGSSDLMNRLGKPLGVACDLSAEMLRSRPDTRNVEQVVAACENLPFAEGRFGGAFCINVLEHVADVDRTLAEAARVLRPGGMFFAVTPNGNWEFWLDLAERLKLKIPEGPHRFLTTERLEQAAKRHFDIRAHRTMLILPAGGAKLASLLDHLSACSAFRWGFFQYLAGTKRT